MASAVPWELSSNVNRPRNAQTSGAYRPPQPPTTWAPPGAPPMPQPGYGYTQPGSYPSQALQYNPSQPPYGGYPPSSSTGWDQSSNPTTQQTTQLTGYDYYNQQPVGESSAPTDANSYNYTQIPPTYTSSGSYTDPAYSHSAAGNHQGYSQPAAAATGFAQHGYGSGSAQDTQQASQPGYGSQPPPTQSGYLPVASPGQPGFGQSHQVPKPVPAQAVYGQVQQPVNQSQTGYAQAAQTYGQPAQGYSQPTGYGQAYVQQHSSSYNDSYGGFYPQSSYSSDGTHGSYEAASSAQGAPGVVAKSSPQT